MADFKSELSGAFKGAVTSARNTVVRDIKGTVSNARNNVVNTIRGTASNAVSAVTGGVMGAASSIMRGDPEGALSSISGITSGVAQAFTQTLDVGSMLTGVPGGILSGPGPGTSFSGSRVPEGNALQGILDRPDPMLSFYWYAQMPIVHSPFGAASLAWNFVETAAPTFRSYDMNSVFRAGRVRKFASAYSLDNLQLGFYMDVANTSMSYLQAWDATIQSPVDRNTMYENGGMYGLPAMYQKDINIYLLSPERDAVAVLTYVEAWPQNIDALALTSDSGSRLIKNVSFAVGDVIVNTLDVPGGVQKAIMQGPNPVSSLAAIAQSALNNAVSTTSRAITGAATRGLNNLFR